ncbi:MAG: hypothetical protein E6R03_16440 [Hyphomicrobiaceae bacterium]|nr:MAG: hypothetical protein E6R03_16440 [Hyphomicrobiaceae bacterium]
MMPPFVLHGLVQTICRDNHADAVVLIIYRERNGLETIAASAGKKCVSLPGLLRDLADHAEDGREIDSLPDTKAGIYKPGDVFEILPGYAQSGWRLVLVRAAEIHAWGIVAFATAPQTAHDTAVFPVRLNWSDVQFIGRPKAKEDGEQPVVQSREADHGSNG